MKPLYTSIILSLMLCQACSEDMPDIAPSRSDTIGFDVTADAVAASRAMSADSLTLTSDDTVHSISLGVTIDNIGAAVSRGVVIDDITSYGVSCYVRDADRDFVYFKDTYVDGLAESGKQYYWLGDESKYDFYAYAPADADIVFGDERRSILSYTVDSDPWRHVDLVAAQSTTDITSTTATIVNYGQPVNLKFTHLLTQVTLTQHQTIAAGVIESVTLSGLYGSGVYDMTSGEWTMTGGADCSYTLVYGESTSPGASITGHAYNFFVMPQVLGPNACLEVVFRDTAGETRKYQAKLTGEYGRGRRVNYTIGISADLGIEISDSDLVQDAHYVLIKDGKLKINIANLPDGRTATLRATASDGAKVSLQLESDLNSLAQEGFWTESYYANGAPTSESARGNLDGTLTGLTNGVTPVAVFLPENASAVNRKVTLTLDYGDGSQSRRTITQLCPAWTGSLGWEQRREGDDVAYGFSWDRIISYQLVYSNDLSFGGNRENYCKKLVNENKTWSNPDFAKVQSFLFEKGLLVRHYRYCVTLDYSKLNTEVALSPTDGRENTLTLYRNAGGASTGAFEATLRSILKTERGHQGERAFRAMTLQDLQYVDNKSDYGPSGDNVSGSEAVAQVLKKNRYYIERSVTVNGDYEVVSLMPKLLEEDVVWFLPAQAQFASLPDTGQYIDVEPVDMRSWSSTAVAGTTHAKLGDGSVVSRKEIHPVRAVRIL